jgi:hypothetical protein
MQTYIKAALNATVVALVVLGTPTHALSQGAMQKGVIHDPVLNMDAYTVTYPAKWHFQGNLVQGSACQSVPFQVFKVSSPDGLTVIERMPRFDWVWGNAPYLAKTQDGCLPLKEAMSAKDFLKYVSAILKVEYVSDEPIDPAVAAAFKKNFDESNEVWAKKYVAAGMTPPTNTGELASANVRYKNGSFTMLGRLETAVTCLNSHMKDFRGQPMETHSCNAGIRYTHAPEAQFKTVISQTSGVGAAAVQDWVNAYMANKDRQTQQNIAAIQRQGAQNIANMTASNQQFQASQATRQRMHQDFLSTMQRGTDMSMHQAAQVANTNHTIASDWTDYSLDQQTVRDPNTGQVSKVSSSNSYTWVDASGKTAYQTNDVNANPNGTLQGTWTRQQVVHGDGTP